ncbi:MAG: periplasmic heavy metal sensor [Candidatus Scalindua sp.]|nr:periplasmic heavy metal sensor [Candidatus Scalindua sp.]MBT5306056.1 periplasmic heavy metal sensor [Candidatus Scalindua sp.]MBT6053296.1 periplasmic heavy metal sensor [Candidatus Scalindua sp.]MBT6227065.1 periplasmic heavy metal sensor [Candidatus Scalindua sp.]MBT6561148.1 periplasmic heavy metal sensor [Candidatus Scalindua sp.]
MSARLKQVLYSVGIVGAMLLTSNVYSQPKGNNTNRHDQMREEMKAKMQEVFKQLDLSPEQEEQLQAHRKNHRGQTGEFREILKAKRETLKNELQKEELNMEEIYKIHNELKGLHSKKADHRLEGILEVRKILTAEQFRKFCELRKEMRSMKRKGKRKEFY